MARPGLGDQISDSRSLYHQRREPVQPRFQPHAIHVNVEKTNADTNVTGTVALLDFTLNGEQSHRPSPTTSRA